MTMFVYLYTAALAFLVLVSPLHAGDVEFVRVHQHFKMMNGIKVSIVPTYTDSKQSVYDDIMTHYKGKPFGDGLGRMVNAHETTHFLNKALRKKYAWKVTSGRIGVFYVLDGRAVVLAEPNIKKRDIIPYIPEFMKDDNPGSSYSTYIKNDAWDDHPLYVFDEWVSYTNDALCGIDDVRNGIYKDGHVNGMDGTIEFSVYAVALGMAVKEMDPEYWNANSKFRGFLKWHIKRSIDTYKLGGGLEQFKYTHTDELYSKFMADESIQSFVKTLE